VTGKPDKIISYQDALFLLEHVRNLESEAGKKYLFWREFEIFAEDNHRCIKILEDCKNAQE
jgi:hypothetical protein